ncbi:hypothetical protein I6F07_21150 [Ensifer sp. IC4062]|nr:hypothetical protein [Ensifer sp. IC4062]MCA1442681.1 hypothetical protein [Ensifer sp. IC4062]
MKSNGFGSWEQRIVVSVEKEHAPRVAAKLGIDPFKEAGEPGRAYFAWTRLSMRRGNDEDIVFDLSMLLGIDGEGNWKVDWSESEY